MPPPKRPMAPGLRVCRKPVCLEAGGLAGYHDWMSRRRIYGPQYARLEPKAVRDYFYRYSLFVRVFTLLSDGLWWLVVKAFQGLILNPLGVMGLIGWLFPFGFGPFGSRLGGPERIRRLHTFVVGRTGSGKSVLLHHLIRPYLHGKARVYQPPWKRKQQGLSLIQSWITSRLRRPPTPTVVLLDPHGDLASYVVRDRVLAHSNRLVYIQFKRLNGRYIHFNPFDLGGTPTLAQLNRAQLQFAGAVERIIGEDFTPRQRTLICACLAVVLHRHGSTLADLVRLLQDDVGNNADLLAYGQNDLPNPIDRQFFQNSFHDPLYRTTKLALVSRLIDILRDPVVQRFACQPSSINLGKLLDSGKIIVVQFDPAHEGRETIRTLGQLISAAILSHVLGRPVHKRHPIHLFVDECQYFISPTIAEILSESRKFGLYLTLATQRTDGLNPKLLEAILGNVGTFWVGGSRFNTAEALCKETGLDPKEVRHLSNLRFIKTGVSQPQTRHRLIFLGKRYAMGLKQWRHVLKAQSITYYRRPPRAGSEGKSPPQNKPPNKISPASWRPKFL